MSDLAYIAAVTAYTAVFFPVMSYVAFTWSDDQARARSAITALSLIIYGLGFIILFR